VVTLEHIEIGTWEEGVKTLFLCQTTSSGNPRTYRNMCVEEGVKTLPLNQLTASGNPRTYKNRFIYVLGLPLALS
jgi:hypothetical protein